MMPDDLLTEQIAKRDPMLALSKTSRITNGLTDGGDQQQMQGEMPLDPGMLKSLGKPVSELLGTVFKLKGGAGLPGMVRITNWNHRTGNVVMQSVRKASEAFEATPAQIDEMIGMGWLDVRQPAQRAGERITSVLRSAMGK